MARPAGAAEDDAAAGVVAVVGVGLMGVMFPTANTLLKASLGSTGRAGVASELVTRTGTIFLRP